MQGYFNWQQSPPPDRESTEVERGELWYICTGYLVRDQDAEALMQWAETVDFWGHWMPETPKSYDMFLGEHGWSLISKSIRQQYHDETGWIQPARDCPVKVKTTAFEYVQEAQGFDCSVDAGYTLRLPANELIAGLGLRWSGNGPEYLDTQGRLVAFDPTVNTPGPSALLLHRTALAEFLTREKLTICWAVLGEKRTLGPWPAPRHRASLRMSGAYTLSKGEPIGFLKCMIDDEEAEDAEHPHKILATLRTPGYQQ